MLCLPAGDKLFGSSPTRPWWQGGLHTTTSVPVMRMTRSMLPTVSGYRSRDGKLAATARSLCPPPRGGVCWMEDVRSTAANLRHSCPCLFFFLPVSPAPHFSSVFCCCVVCAYVCMASGRGWGATLGRSSVGSRGGGNGSRSMSRSNEQGRQHFNSTDGSMASSMGRSELSGSIGAVLGGTNFSRSRPVWYHGVTVPDK